MTPCHVQKAIFHVSSYPMQIPELQFDDVYTLHWCHGSRKCFLVCFCCVISVCLYTLTGDVVKAELQFLCNLLILSTGSHDLRWPSCTLLVIWSFASEINTAMVWWTICLWPLDNNIILVQTDYKKTRKEHQCWTDVSALLCPLVDTAVVLWRSTRSTDEQENAAAYVADVYKCI